MIEIFDDINKLKQFESENKIVVKNIFETQEDYRYDDGTYHYTLYNFFLVYEPIKEKEKSNE